MRRVVITGLGVVTPIGQTVSEFSDQLFAGACGVGPITRFDASAFKAKVCAEVKDFDPVRFGIERGEARRMDLFAQFAVAAADQAVRQSGICEAVAPERLGVYVGSGIGGMHTFVTETQKLLERGPARVSPLYIPMMIGNIAAGNIAIRFGAKGSALPIMTACASGTHSIGEAYRAIKDGYLDAVIAGGTEAAIEALAMAGFMNMKALSEEPDPLLASLPFDARRAGFVMGEGAGIVVMETLEAARARGATILAECVGYESTCDAYHITAPDPDGQGAMRAYESAYRQASVAASDVVYINAHGTGTPLNDAAETRAIKRALGETAARAAHISSTKSMTGHMLGAAGGVECVACVLALQSGRVPPTIHLDEPDPACDLDYTPHRAVDAPLTVALSGSLGFGGHNAVLALRRVPA